MIVVDVPVTAAAANLGNTGGDMSEKPTYEELEKRVRELEESNLEYKRTEESLRAREHFLSTILQSSAEGYWVVDGNGLVTDMNEAYCANLGYTREEILGLHISDIDAEEASAQTEERIQRVIANRSELFETSHRRKDGSIFPVEVSVTYLGEEEGKFVCFGRDLTERKRAEKDLAHSHDLMRYIIEHANSSVAVHDRDLRYIYVSQRYMEEHKVKERDIIGRHYYEVFPDMPRKWRDAHQKALAGEISREERDQYRRTASTVDWMRWECRPWYEADGLIGGIIIYSEVITERVQAEESLRESEARQRSLFDQSVEGIFLHDLEGRILDVNRMACLQSGYSRDELLQLTVFDLHAHQADKENLSKDEIISQWNQWLPNVRKTVETEHLNKDGEVMPVQISTGLISYGNQKVMLAIVQDITERRKVEAERARLISAVEQAAEIIVITDPEGTIQYANPAFERITGYGSEEVKGQKPRILKSGQQDDRFYQELWQTIKNGESWQGRMINKRKDGGLYTEEATISPVIDTKGKIRNFVAVKRDITSEINLEARLAQAQKMEAIGTLAGGIAHDFNNILAVIVGYAEMLEYDLRDGSPSKENIGQIITACKRAKDLVKQILTFSRQGEQEVKPLRLDLIIKETLKMIRSSLPASIDINQSIKASFPTVFADHTQVHQIMMNLCTNAAQAIEDEHGTIHVVLDEIQIEKDANNQMIDLKPGRYVRLKVSDTGTGIPKEIRKRIFEPYFTTKKAGEGTGLGLSVVYGIVKEYGGDILVESDEGVGSTFSVFFPASEKEQPSPSMRNQAILPLGVERILFIDDEPLIARLGKEYLERLGYKVTIRQCALEALELFRNDPDRFDLVVTDMTMPQMTGDEVAAEMLKIRTDIPIILCTGYSRRISEKRAKEIGIRAFVMKPLAPHDFAHTVRKVLDEEKKGRRSCSSMIEFIC